MIWFLILLQIVFAGLSVFVSPWYLIGLAILFSLVIAFQYHHEKHMMKYYEKLNASNDRIDKSCCEAIECLRMLKNKLDKDITEVLEIKKKLLTKD